MINITDNNTLIGGLRQRRPFPTALPDFGCDAELALERQLHDATRMELRAALSEIERLQGLLDRQDAFVQVFAAEFHRHSISQSCVVDDHETEVTR